MVAKPAIKGMLGLNKDVEIDRRNKPGTQPCTLEPRFFRPGHLLQHQKRRGCSTTTLTDLEFQEIMNRNGDLGVIICHL